MLSGLEIIKQRSIGNIVIDPFNPDNVNPNSYNLTLDNKLMVYTDRTLDMKVEPKTSIIDIPIHGYTLQPGRLYLAKTKEYTETNGFVPLIDGRSSIGRLGIFIHVTAGFGDNGFCGCWTLEIVVVQPVTIYSGVSIAQIRFDKIDGRSDKYNGKYQGNREIQKSMLFKDFIK